MADPAAPVQISMPLDDDLIAAVTGKGVALERALAIQTLRNQKATLDALNALLAVQKLPAAANGNGAVVAIQKA